MPQPSYEEIKELARRVERETAEYEIDNQDNHD